MRLFRFVLFFLFSPLVLAKPLNFYFDSNIQFDPDIPTPQSVLGYEVGDWHVRHDQLVRYMQVLANKSDRIKIETIGYSHEQRPLLMLTVTNPQKLQNIDEIQAKHIARLSDGEIKTNEDDPAVVWMGYSVHGNESSGSNASLLVAYYLAAAQGEKIESLLNNTVILIDPSLNPDGLSRFAQWANMHKGQNLSSDPNHREHVEAWPNGRTNHYWFDLNRDWLLLQHPESRARVAKFHQWKPNVLTDFHEMGPHSTYFFQPGISSRKHPLTPERNVTLTKDIAVFHAKALDKQNALYFTEESFDDFYYGKGSTYPDINGSIGILFEQASSRGHQQDTINGLLEFPTTIKNQLTTSLSTFDAAIAGKKNLLDYQDDFYTNAIELANNDNINGYLVSETKDKTRLNQFLMLLKRHQISAYKITKDIRIENKDYAHDTSFYIPLEQAQYRLIKAIFSEQKDFQDNTFYDVSGWTIAHAFNIEFASLTSKWGLKYSQSPWQTTQKKPLNKLSNHYAYAFEWDDYLAPKMLNRLLKKGIKARVALKDLTAETDQGRFDFSSGTIILPAGLQTIDNWINIVDEIRTEFAIPILGITSGLTSKGIDLGSRQLAPVSLPKVLLIGGEGTSQYEVGEIWYYLDKFVGIAPTVVDIAKLGKINFDKYTHAILANGSYHGFSDAAKVKMKSWIKEGGVIWGHKGGAKFLVDNKILKAGYISQKEMAETFDSTHLTYADKNALSAKQRIAGAIYKTQLDLSHPLTFSIPRKVLPVFKNSTFLLEPVDAPFVNVALYDKKPLMAGFSHQNNVKQISKAAALIAHSYGRGRVIGMTDNPVFRGYWFGTSRLLSNALFFGKTFSAKPK
ncbi:M14 metallopeptidase family protein [Pseudoalteromonas denitrificans]|uniref:Zinc carboxypeptidase n=1 Tax=Pseudoalteromonas denitrificans DSM 6059 TaxID=1123010 RepID=A0A1I1QUP7_9GAMM|nr:M14 metallopeptidase family protein [Pseudoalteromonas denitrificans]SFD21770.1 Zinc carboxypeptidase [Pseudoalteromonas denitrificans DSM 6059]